MASIQLSRSPEYMLSEPGLYTQSQLGVEPIHETLHAYWEAEQTALEAPVREYDEAKRSLVIARASRERHRHKVRIAARSFANDLIEINGGNRKSDAYLGYFEDGYGLFTRLTLPNQIARARSILVRLDSETDEEIRTAGEAFRATVAEAELALADWEAKSQAVVDARSRLHTAKIRWRRAYRKVEADLRSLHSDDPRYVASFFLVRPSRKGKGGLDEDEGDELEVMNGSGNGSSDGVSSNASGSGNGVSPAGNGNGNGSGSGGSSSDDGGSGTTVDSDGSTVS